MPGMGQWSGSTRTFLHTSSPTWERVIFCALAACCWGLFSPGELGIAGAYAQRCGFWGWCYCVCWFSFQSPLLLQRSNYPPPRVPDKPTPANACLQSSSLRPFDLRTIVESPPRRRAVKVLRPVRPPRPQRLFDELVDPGIQVGLGLGLNFRLGPPQAYGDGV